jgi:Helix-turn-helix domain
MPPPAATGRNPVGRWLVVVGVSYFLTVAEAAEMGEFSRATIRRLARSGELDGEFASPRKINGVWMIPEDGLARWWGRNNPFTTPPWLLPLVPSGGVELVVDTNTLETHVRRRPR